MVPSGVTHLEAEASVRRPYDASGHRGPASFVSFLSFSRMNIPRFVHGTWGMACKISSLSGI